MRPEAIREQERRLAALTYEQSPCQAFNIEPQVEDSPEWVELVPGPEGETFLTYWMSYEALQRLRLVALSEREPGVWTLALEFGEGRWVSYTLRAMARSSWSGVLFPLADLRKTWPEGVVLDPDEVEYALQVESDLLGVVIAGETRKVAAFIANDYNEYELEALIKRLRDPYQVAAYLMNPSPLIGLPRPALILDFPEPAPLEPIQFLPPQPDITLGIDEDPDDRLFKEHWILRLLNPPEKELDHVPE